MLTKTPKKKYLANNKPEEIIIICISWNVVWEIKNSKKNQKIMKGYSDKMLFEN